MLLKHQIVVFHSNSDLIVQTWSVIGNPPRNRWFKFQMERSGYGWHTVHLVTCFTPLWAVRQCTSNVRQCCRKSCKISKCKHSILAGEGYATHACQFNISYGPQPVILSTNCFNGEKKLFQWNKILHSPNDWGNFSFFPMLCHTITMISYLSKPYL